MSPSKHADVSAKALGPEEGYIAYVDLLGMKDDVQTGKVQYAARIKKFYSVIAELEDNFKKSLDKEHYDSESPIRREGREEGKRQTTPVDGTSLMVLTDSLIVCTKSLSRLLKFLSELRGKLVQSASRGHEAEPPAFFRAGIAKGSIKNVGFREFVAANCGDEIAREVITQGSGFNESLMLAYTTEQNTKGICINISQVPKEDFRKVTKDIERIKTFYVGKKKHEGRQNYAIYEAYDIGIARHYLKEEWIDRVFDATIDAALFVEHAAPYYVPIIYATVKSAPLTEMIKCKSLEEAQASGHWVAWHIFHELFRKGVFREIASIPCVHLISVAALIKILEFEKDLNKLNQTKQRKKSFALSGLNPKNSFHAEIIGVKQKIVRLAGLRTFVRAYNREYFAHETPAYPELKQEFLRAVTRRI